MVIVKKLLIFAQIHLSTCDLSFFPLIEKLCLSLEKNMHSFFAENQQIQFFFTNTADYAKAEDSVVQFKT